MTTASGVYRRMVRLHYGREDVAELARMFHVDPDTQAELISCGPNDTLRRYFVYIPVRVALPLAIRALQRKETYSDYCE